MHALQLEAIEARLHANKLAGRLAESDADLNLLRKELEDIQNMKTVGYVFTCGLHDGCRFRSYP